MRQLLTSFTILFALCLLTVVDLPAQSTRRDPFVQQRLNMVREYIEREGVKNERVLEAMRTVPRHEFMLSTMKKRAYHDGAYPIGYKQTISPPFIVAYMTETIDPQRSDKVLEIGTGSGYQAAVLSGLVSKVYTIEIVEPLGRKAARLLKKLKYDNVHAKVGDGFKGWKEHAPFDKIIVTCSPENIPKPLVEQLKEGGIMLIPIGERYQQVFHLLQKKDGKLVDEKLIPTLFVPMTGISEENRRVKPDPLNPKIVNGDFELDVNGDDKVDHWHYQRQVELVEGDDAKSGKRYLKFSNNEAGRFSQLLQGMPVMGSKVGTMKIELWAKYERTVAGRFASQKPAVVVLFYNAIRKPIGETIVGPWTGSLEWQPYTKTIKIPRSAREAIIRIGLNGATGELCVDDIKLTVQKR